MPPAGLAAIVEFHGSINAKKGWGPIAYGHFRVGLTEYRNN